MNFLKKNLNGILVCFVIAVPSWLLGKTFPVVGGPVIAILAGMLITLVWTNKGKAESGIKWTSKIILQTAVVLLGFGMNLGVILQTGKQSLPIIVCTISTSLIIAWLLRKIIKVPSNTSILVGVGSSICGGSAIAATAPVIDADDTEVAQAISVIFFFNVIAAVLFPVLGSALGFDTTGGGSFRPGPVYTAAKAGGFAILDEINMAKSEAMAVLHATLDFRRTIDVPGYERMELHPATRFIATMNYGYAGTKELNEALVSRFVVIQMPMISKESLIKLIRKHYPDIREEGAGELTFMFLELHKKCENGEISSKALDLRGLLGAVGLMEKGLDIFTALDMGITNKTFDTYEQTLIRDTIRTRISKKMVKKDLFVK